MPKRSLQQKIGAMGQMLAMSIIEDSHNWMARWLGQDFGVDAEAEYVDGEDSLRGAILKIQVKSSRTVKRQDGKICLEIERKYLLYAQQCRYPLIMVRISTTEKMGWYLWLQDWMIRNNKLKPQDLDQKSWSAWVDESDSLVSGLAGPLVSIAKWRGETQLCLSLLDAFRAAVATQNHGAMDSIGSLLAQLPPSIADASLNDLLQEMIPLRGDMRTIEGGLSVASQLYRSLKTLGGRASLETVHMMVGRKSDEGVDTYSRSGLHGLSILYDNFLEHITSLNLPTYFSEKHLPQVAYFCALRETHPRDSVYAYGREVITLATFEFSGMRCDISAPSTSILDMLANRGASAILDCLVLGPSPRSEGPSLPQSPG